MRETEIPGSRRIRKLELNILQQTDLNPSLFYGKFAKWNPIGKEDSDKTNHIKQLIKLSGWCAEAQELADWLHNGAKIFSMTTATRLLIGRGTPSVFEQGISLHPLFGLPFLPGSAIKGVTATWAAANGEDEAVRGQIFGPPTENEEKAQGKVVFLDAVPLQRQCLELEVLAPHYHGYYSKQENHDWPSDEESPQVFFLPAVKRGVTFQFAVRLAATAKGESELLTKAQKWIESALEEFGIGSKTGSNYGYFQAG